jgi:hypothetical protein
MNNSDIDMQISILYGNNHSKMKQQNICEEEIIREKESRKRFRIVKLKAFFN